MEQKLPNVILMGLTEFNKPIYRGTVDKETILKRRAKNRAARKARRHARK